LIRQVNQETPAEIWQASKAVTARISPGYAEAAVAI